MTTVPSRPLSIVFGGSGFIGKHLISKLIDLGHEVISADLVQNTNSVSFQQIQCDVRLPIEFSPSRSPNYVFNLAAVHRTPGHPDIEYFQTNVSGALNIVDWCERVSAQCLLFTSSISVYGVDPGAKSENSTLNPSGAYGFSKKFAEEIQTSWQSKSPTNRRLIICRPAVMFGAGEKGNFTRLAKGLKYRYFFFPNGPDTLKACGFVEDLIASFIFVLDQDENFVLFNFCYPENYTIGQICTTFNLVTGAKYPHSLPGKRVASFLLHFGKPWDLLASRAMKLITDTEINPLYLEHQGFEWGSNIQSALQKWFDLNRIDGIY